MTAISGGTRPHLRLDGRPIPLRAWLADVWHHRAVLEVLARKDFRIRYKRTRLGPLWALIVPLLQAATMAVVFTKVARFDSGGLNYAVYVLSGVLAWNYFTSSLGPASSAIADGAGLSEKVWFPRALLALVPIGANLANLAIFAVLTVGAVLLFDGGALVDLWLLLPAGALLVAFTASVALVVSAVQVYVRDLRFVVGAAFQIWFYLTPVIYPLSFAGRFGEWLSLNPMTGIVSLYHAAAVDGLEVDRPGLAVTVATTVVLLAVGVSVQRRYDRLFVDRL